MFVFLWFGFIFGTCEPAQLFLHNGSSIWADCGWQRNETTVVLQFRDFRFHMKAELVDWQKTRAAGRKMQNKHALPTAERDPWQNLVETAKPSAPGKRLRVTNQNLEELLKKKPEAKTVPEATSTKTAKRIAGLEKSLAYLRKVRRQLKAQLREEITWQQAEYLMEQVDLVEQRIREKAYWLERLKKAQESNPTSDTATHARVLDGHGAWVAIPKWVVTYGNCVTLNPCSTDFFSGDRHGQSHSHHRGPRA